MQKAQVRWASVLAIGILCSLLANADHCSNVFDETSSAIDPLWVEKMKEKGKARSDHAQRIRNAIQISGIDTLISNRELLATHHRDYTMEIPTGVITNQKSSGRCWIYAGHNILRAKLIGDRKVPIDFEFSANYLYFFSLLEKSNTYLESTIKTPPGRDSQSQTQSRIHANPSVEDGGWWSHFVFLVKKYGLAPRGAMPETFGSENTAELKSELEKHLGAIAHEIHLFHDKFSKQPTAPKKIALRKIKEKGLRGVWKILATHLGDPPRNFEINTQYYIERNDTHSRVENFRRESKKWNPLGFRDSLRFSPEDYVIVSANHLKTSNRVYRIEGSAIGKPEAGKSAYHLRRLNLTHQKLQDLVERSIAAGEPVWFAADVKKDADFNTGILHPSLISHQGLYDFRADEKPKTLNSKNKRWFQLGTPSHAMAILGVDRPHQDKPIVKFKVENSWGNNGDGGFLHMYREWFEEHAFEIVVHQSLLSKEQLVLWKGPAEKLSRGEWYY